MKAIHLVELLKQVAILVLKCFDFVLKNIVIYLIKKIRKTRKVRHIKNRVSNPRILRTGTGSTRFLFHTSHGIMEEIEKKKMVTGWVFNELCFLVTPVLDCNK